MWIALYECHLSGAYQQGTPLVAWGALLGVMVSTLTGFLLGLSLRDAEQGLWGFNGILVGCAFPTFLGQSSGMWLALVLCAAMTTWVRAGFNNVMAPWKVNSFTFPFVFCTWIFLLAARALRGIPIENLSPPMLPHEFSSDESLHILHLMKYWLKGISQVFLINSWQAGALMLLGMFISNRWAGVWTAIGSALALWAAIGFGAAGKQVESGLYSFSSVLTAIALATIFYKPNWRSALWALTGVVATVFVQGAMNMLLLPLGIPTLTGPFCVATWLFLLPMVRLDEQTALDHSNWSEENKPHLAHRRRPSS